MLGAHSATGAAWRRVFLPNMGRRYCERCLRILGGDEIIFATCIPAEHRGSTVNAVWGTACPLTPRPFPIRAPMTPPSAGDRDHDEQEMYDGVGSEASSAASSSTPQQLRERAAMRHLLQSVEPGPLEPPSRRLQGKQAPPSGMECSSRTQKRLYQLTGKMAISVNWKTSCQRSSMRTTLMLWTIWTSTTAKSKTMGESGQKIVVQSSSTGRSQIPEGSSSPP